MVNKSELCWILISKNNYNKIILNKLIEFINLILILLIFLLLFILRFIYLNLRTSNNYTIYLIH